MSRILKSVIDVSHSEIAILDLRHEPTCLVDLVLCGGDLCDGRGGLEGEIGLAMECNVPHGDRRGADGPTLLYQAGSWRRNPAATRLLWTCVQRVS